MIYNEAKKLILDGTIDLDTHDMRVALIMNGTTADTENDGITKMNSFTTLDECDASGYARVALASKVVNKDDANDRAEFDAADISFTGLGGNATRDYQGVLLYKRVDGTAANDIPVAFIPFNTSLNKGASQVDVPWDAEGILQAA